MYVFVPIGFLLLVLCVPLSSTDRVRRTPVAVQCVVELFCDWFESERVSTHTLSVSDSCGSCACVLVLLALGVLSEVFPSQSSTKRATPGQLSFIRKFGKKTFISTKESASTSSMRRFKLVASTRAAATRERPFRTTPREGTQLSTQ